MAREGWEEHDVDAEGGADVVRWCGECGDSGTKSPGLPSLAARRRDWALAGADARGEEESRGDGRPSRKMRGQHHICWCTVVGNST
uniref:Uncharacterized protein n=1 Tax=Arundo donax TaxID=35708 RepID=A0A0A8YAT9_ARUDO